MKKGEKPMDWITGIQRALDYVEAHLTDEIDFDRVAAESFSSSYHFQRTFSILCGHSLGEYVRMRRLTLAGAELASTGAKVIDVALKYGYDSPDSFTKAFRAFHGITPTEAKRGGAPLRSFSRLSIKISLEGGSTMNYRVEEKAPFSVIERVESHDTAGGENNKTIPAFWDRAATDGTIKTLESLASDNTYTFGICYANPDKTSTKFDYSIAVKCDTGATVPENFRKTEIPARTWLIFECIGAMPDAIQETWRKIVSEVFPNSPYTPTYEMDIEAYTDGDMSSPDYRSEIWIPVENK